MIKAIIDSTPITFHWMIRRRLKLGRKYHSGTISRGVENALELYIISKGCSRDTPNIIAITPNINTGNMYKMSLGHAGSPYLLLDMPPDKPLISGLLSNLHTLTTDKISGEYKDNGCQLETYLGNTC